MDITLATPIAKLTRVGAITAGRLARLNIATVKDLLEHYPMRYEDYSQILNANELNEGLTGSISGLITDIQNKDTKFRKMKITEAYLENNGGQLKVIWFNQPFITQTLKNGDNITLAGKIERDWAGYLMRNPLYERTGQAVHTSRLVPIYPTTANLTQKQIRFLIKEALGAVEMVRENIPEEIIKNFKLTSRARALRLIHNPSNAEDCAAARRRLKFEELFLIQLATARGRAELAAAAAPAIPFQEQATKRLVAGLPFTLTADQKKAAWRILKDLSRPQPMNRLLQGEVGSGKTVVAAIAALNAAEGRWQTAIMAPTEILAFQHYQTISQLFPSRPVALLTSKYSLLSSDVIARSEPRPDVTSGRGERRSNPDASATNSEIASVASTLPRNDIKKAISDGEVDIIIGTHAIIQNDITFNNLGLIVIDEQHRFGVEQRKLLKNKTKGDLAPHLLSMTATPIPRSLALTVYGDLDISAIRQLPQNRLPITTKIVSPAKRKEAYEFIRAQIRKGRQAFVICPLIEESDKLGVKAVTTEYEKLKTKIFPELKLGLLHGKMPSRAKEAVMAAFKNKEINILISTSVVEVGVDVPNASIMMIEGAERFGLSQLHQFRGRVGRGEWPSYCFLCTNNNNPAAIQRLRAFTAARDGFAIAELDLQMRGAGQIYGTEQSGRFTDLAIATLADGDLLEQTREAAQELLKKDPKLAHHPSLASELQRRSRGLYFE